jgi:hypothetical protein
MANTPLRATRNRMMPTSSQGKGARGEAGSIGAISLASERAARQCLGDPEPNGPGTGWFTRPMQERASAHSYQKRTAPCLCPIASRPP